METQERLTELEQRMNTVEHEQEKIETATPSILKMVKSIKAGQKRHVIYLGGLVLLNMAWTTYLHYAV